MPRPSRAPVRRAPDARRAPWLRLAVPVAVLALALGTAACRPVLGSAQGARDQGPADRLRLGYFATVTHAPALVGLARGTIQASLGETELATEVFTAGPAALEALNAGAVDAAFLGPNPAITGFVMSEGKGLRVVSGATAGGAQLVVRAGIDSAADLRGAILASPQLGGTQDVALRAWLTDHGLENRLRGGGDVTVTPTANAQALQLFRDGSLDGAWVPEPWASRMVLEGGGHVLVDEASLWPDGRFPTTYLVVSSVFLAEHPATVEALVEGTVEAIEWSTEHPDEAAAVVDAALTQLTGLRLAPEVLDRAMRNVQFTADPIADALRVMHADAVRAGTAPQAGLEGILDLGALDAVLAERGRPPVPDAGLGNDRTTPSGPAPT